MKLSLFNGDCMEALKQIPSNYVDALVTDPPYGLSNHSQKDILNCLESWLKEESFSPDKKGFMNHTWDNWVPSPIVWKEVFRVLKPGAHGLIFAGTRSMDLMSISLRLAGFELRDSIGYATGASAPLIAWIQASGFPHGKNVSKAIDAKLKLPRKVVFSFERSGRNRGILGKKTKIQRNVTESISEISKKWEGWNTSLKPAWEPIILIRKPLEGTLADNVLQHGVGALNVSACSIPTSESLVRTQGKTSSSSRCSNVPKPSQNTASASTSIEGRYPSNVILNDTPEVMEALPKTKARFFYCPKANNKDKQLGLTTLDNTHPTIKPIELLRYLCKLICPPEGIILDPFLGSGSTGKAVILEKAYNEFIGIELNPDYFNVSLESLNNLNTEIEND